MIKISIFLFVSTIFFIDVVNSYSLKKQLLKNSKLTLQASTDHLNLLLHGQKKHLLAQYLFRIMATNLLCVNNLSCAEASEYVQSAAEKLYVSDKGLYSFEYSSDLSQSPKPLKTHKSEIYLKSETVKGFNVGLTVRRILIFFYYRK